MDYTGRQQRLAQALDGLKLDALLVTHAVNVRYVCGFTGSNAVLVAGPRRCILLTDGRYAEQANAEAQNVRVVIARGALLPEAAKILKKQRTAAAGIEAEHMPVAQRSILRGLLPKKVRLRETTGVVEQLRMMKEAAEISNLRQSVLLGARLFDTALEAVRPGVREIGVAAELEYAARRLGAEAMAFDTIVAAGRRSALPHGRASAAPIPARGFVVLDWGVKLAGYCSDQTRTVHVGTPDSEMRGQYMAVREAQQAAMEAVRAGATAGDVDRAARQALQHSGLARYFTHSTGHGVGLEIHEAPRLGKGLHERLRAGMIVTIEPGVYVPGKGGVRIEDMLCVTETGCEVLTPTTRELITL
ncbi:MAG: aminopeptidase P family protein [Acidobacteria bacterium]|nr:aminopeptidase P family protein [Acidobacteriota bacterium]